MCYFCQKRFDALKGCSVTTQSSKNPEEKSAEQEAREAEFARYMVYRQPADDAMSAEDYELAMRLYAQGARKTIADGLEKENRAATMFAGACACAMRSEKYSLALRYLRNSFEHLSENEPVFADTMNYLIDQIHSLPYYLKTSAQRELLESIKSEYYQKFSSCLRRAFFSAQKKLAAQAPEGEAEKRKLHGVDVIDKFPFLEDLFSKVTQSYIKKEYLAGQNFLQLALLDFKLPEEYFRKDRQQPNRIPFRVGKNYYFRMTDPSTRHRIVRCAQNVNRKGKIILSGQEVCPPDYFINSERYRKDGKYIAYGISKHGSDWEEWYVKSTVTGRQIPHLKLDIRHGGIMFHPDGKGLVYWKQGKPENVEDHLKVVEKSVRIYYKPLHPKDSKEHLIYAPKDEEVDRVNLNFLMDGKFMLIQEKRKGETKGRFYILKAPKAQLIPLFAGKARDCVYMGWRRNKLYFETNDAAPNGKVFSLTLDDGGKPAKVETVIPECEKVISETYLLMDRIMVNYLVDRSTKSEIVSYPLDGGAAVTVPLPAEGIVDNLSCSYDDSNLFFSINSFSNASSIFLHNLKSRKTRLYFAPTGQPCRDLVSEVVNVKSKDGSIVPMWLVHRKKVKLGPDTPVLMMVYGGFNVPCLPYCNYEILSWTEMGGVWAQPYLRGGGELGEHWHESAKKLKKQNTFDDAIACAKYLIDNKLASPAKLAVKGGSNGGLTVAVLLNQAPECFAAAIASNGLYDMLKFQNHTIGWAWECDYGSVAKKKEFQTIFSYSPIHNLRKVSRFPALLLCASEGDDRVPPWHTMKYLAELRQHVPAESILVLRIERKSGHVSHRSSWEIRDQQAFLKQVLGM